MCGIAGIISFSSSHFPFQQIADMNQALAHRGPDDEGIVFFSGNKAEPSVFGGNSTPNSVYASKCHYCPSVPFTRDLPFNTKLALGHRRLSIIDLSSWGHQPMCTEDGRYWIVYNGEIYNYTEIRNELLKVGEKFLTNTDTEVLLKAYRLWGSQCLTRLNGMWAFVIYDRKANRLFISRDRFGKKPLYYYLDPTCFVFASEIKALLKVPAVKTAPDIGQCTSYIEHGCQEIGRATAFQNIYRFSPGTYAEVQVDQVAEYGLNEKKFWELNANLSNEPFNAEKANKFSNEYYDLLLDAVRIRLRADVTVGSALSGGLDSSSIVYLINQLLKAKKIDERQMTFSSIYKSKHVRDCDESIFIDKLAQFLNVNAKQIEPRYEDVPAEHRRMIYAMDTPPEGTCMSGWHTFKCAKLNKVKVTLDGQGADEQLAGYLPYLTTYLYGCKYQAFNEAWYLLQLPGSTKFIVYGLLLKLGKSIFKKKNFNTIFKLLGRKSDFNETLNGRLLKDTLKNLITLIHFSDRVSMAHAVESRMPFMDYRLVEYLAALPASYKIHRGWTKYIARLSMDNKLPGEITWRKDKMGWPVPEAYWFKHPLRDWFHKKINDSIFLRELGYSQIRWSNSGNANINRRQVRLLNLSVWYDVFFQS